MSNVAINIKRIYSGIEIRTPPKTGGSFANLRRAAKAPENNAGKQSHETRGVIGTMNPEHFRATESIVIDATPDAIYDTITDITRTGEWSPIVETCWWENPHDGDPQIGDAFHGRNVTPERTWETRCVVTAAERPRTFAWSVADGVVNWGFHIAPAEVGSTLTETWEVTEKGFDFFRNKYGEEADTALEDRRQAALSGIPATLARIKEILES